MQESEFESPTTVACINDALAYPVALFGGTPADFRLFGTGSMIEAHGSSFLVSAKHCFDTVTSEAGSNMYLCTGPGNLHHVHGRTSFFTADQGDAQVLRLSSKIEWKAAAYERRPIALEQMQRAPEAAPPIRTWYVFAGYPVSRSSRDRIRGTTHVVLNMNVLKEAEQELYQRLRLSQETHLVLDFDHRKLSIFVNGNGRTPAKPQGMSGSMVWRVEVKGDGGCFKTAVAVATDHKKSLRAIVCSRIDSVEPTLRRLAEEVV